MSNSRKFFIGLESEFGGTVAEWHCSECLTSLNFNLNSTDNRKIGLDGVTYTNKKSLKFVTLSFIKDFTGSVIDKNILSAIVSGATFKIYVNEHNSFSKVFIQKVSVNVRLQELITLEIVAVGIKDAIEEPTEFTKEAFIPHTHLNCIFSNTFPTIDFNITFDSASRYKFDRETASGILLYDVEAKAQQSLYLQENDTQYLDMENSVNLDFYTIIAGIRIGTKNATINFNEPIFMPQSFDVIRSVAYTYGTPILELP